MPARERILIVPMLKDNELVGAIGIYRTGSPALHRQADRAGENFAAQAVIAIENTRLLNELRQRTDDLSESLEQQTATSRGAAKSSQARRASWSQYFRHMLGNAVRICEAKFGNLCAPRRRDVSLRWRCTTRRLDGRSCDSASLSFDQARTVLLCASLRPSSWSICAISGLSRATFGGDPAVVAAGRAGRRSDCSRGSDAQGKRADRCASPFTARRFSPFTDKQIELVQNFAAQAVIAIENTRLLNELRQRTDDLTSRWSSRPRPRRC